MDLCVKSALSVSLAEVLLLDLHSGIAAQTTKRPIVLWVELGSCTGDSISLDNSLSPNLKDLLHNVIDLRYHWLLMNVEGERALSVLRRTAQENSGEFILVVEGSVMLADGGTWDYAGYSDGALLTGVNLLHELASQAKHIVAIGTCASFGGPSATKPNPSHSVGVQAVLDRLVINTPGCPCHPDWFIGTLYHLINYGIPELDTYNRPKLFYGRLIHDQCQRRTYFEHGIFAQHPGEPWCMYAVGCRGPRTYADCPNREWNNTDNWPVGCNTPCIGCVEPGFPEVAMPFFQRYPDVKLPGFTTSMDTAALGIGVASLGGIGVHLGANVLSRRLRKNLVETTLPLNPPAPRSLAQQQSIQAPEETVRRHKKRPSRVRRSLRP